MPSFGQKKLSVQAKRKLFHLLYFKYFLSHHSLQYLYKYFSFLEFLSPSD